MSVERRSSTAAGPGALQPSAAPTRRGPAVLHDLLDDPGRVEGMSPSEARDLLAALGPVLAAVARRAAEPECVEAEPVTDGDRLLTAEQAAQRLGCTVRWLRGRRLPFRRELSPRVVRYSEAGLERYLRNRARV